MKKKPFSCLPPWISALVDNLNKPFRLTRDPSESSSYRLLPSDIIINIISRLPAECVTSCCDECKTLCCIMSTPSFARIHLQRSTPVIAFSTHDNRLHIFNETTSSTKRIDGYLFSIFCSYNGFLVERGRDYHNIVILNPLTQQKFVVSQRSEHGGGAYGLFVHPQTMEYQILFINKTTNQGYIYGLMSHYSKSIGAFDHMPASEKAPVIINEALHWMVDDNAYHKQHGVWPNCEDSIVLFHIVAENFSTTSHPGNQCGLRKKHCKMELLEIKGSLGFCDVSSNKLLEIWVLEDYVNKFWEKRHLIVIETVLSFAGIRPSFGSHGNVGGFHIYKGDLLLQVSDSNSESDRNVVLYNLQSGTMRRVVQSKGKKYPTSNFFAIPHHNSLILDIDQKLHQEPAQVE